MENNIILEKSIAFSAAIVELALTVPPSYKVLASQLMRSGTSIGASIAEAQSAESMTDFVHKLKIADKEANETVYWLRLLNTQLPSFGEDVNGKLMEIKKLLTSIIITCNRKRKTKSAL